MEHPKFKQRVYALLKTALALAVLFSSFLFGYLSHRNFLFPHKFALAVKRVWAPEESSLWWQNRRAVPQVDEERMKRLAALGYVSGYKPPPSRTGVVLMDETKVFGGYNLYTSGDGPYAVLMGMAGEIMHSWSFDPGYGRDWYRRVYTFENGDLLVLIEYVGLFKLDKYSQLIWQFEGTAHHDFEVLEDGSILVLTRAEHQYEDLCGSRAMWDDYITLLDGNGRKIAEYSIAKAFAGTKYASLLRQLTPCEDPEAELFHTNTIEVIPPDREIASSPFRRGSILVSARDSNLIAVIDPDSRQVTWAMTGMWERQHQPTLLENGNILIFDNQGHFGFSKVIEFDPLTHSIEWAYEGNSQNGFNTPVLGSSQRLPNGNTLITDSTAGRAFEVDPSGLIVWEFMNPKTVKRDVELIAAIPEMVRLPPDFPTDWLE